METLFVGTNLLEFDCLPSTNSFLLDLSKQKRMPEGTVVLAKHQSEGRGQYGTLWKVRPNLNLTFSLIVYPKWLAVDHQFALSKMVALSIYEYLASRMELVSIKWPNDIYVGQKKIAGVLIENALDQSGLKQSVIGIGINVNQMDFDPELMKATSMKMELGKDQDLRQMLNAICKNIEKNYLKLKSSASAMNELYQEHLYQKGIWSKYKDEAGVFEGFLLGVDSTGKLEIKDKEEVVRLYNLKEVSFL